jgi:hypothetical protein
MSISTIWLPHKFRRICKIFSEKRSCTPLDVRRSVARSRTTKDSSAPGPSQITYGLIKQLPQVILQEVYQFLCDIWEGRLTPEEWKLKWQQPIPKKVDSGTGFCRVEDFRPLRLVDTFRKIWSNIIKKRIPRVWEESGVAHTEL